MEKLITKKYYKDVFNNLYSSTDFINYKVRKHDTNKIINKTLEQLINESDYKLNLIEITVDEWFQLVLTHY
jgi:hypothetical protein